MKKRLSQKEFDQIYAKVPRAAIDLIIIKNKKILLTKRSISPFKGMWHVPGGGIFHREKFRDCITRIAKEELGIKVKPVKLIGYLEVLRDGPHRHTILFELKCQIVGNKKPRPVSQASECRFFEKLPTNTLPDQKRFLEKNWKRVIS